MLQLSCVTDYQDPELSRTRIYTDQFKLLIESLWTYRGGAKGGRQETFPSDPVANQRGSPPINELIMLSPNT